MRVAVVRIRSKECKDHLALILTQESEYALKILSQLIALPAKQARSAGWVAMATGLRESFVAKIMQKLVHAGILHSQRGHLSGYHLARPAAAITLRHILEATEGSDLFERCIFGKDRCSDTAPCVLHDQWAAIKAAFTDMAEQTTLDSLAQASTEQRAAAQAFNHPWRRRRRPTHR